MEKTLTISVACYNVGQFLRKTLDSLIAPEIMDELEVLVVNDGSSDGTAEIAREYEEKYPQTFRLVDKANGGYGSTLNYSMPAARGRYFKQLDGDDWYNTEGLVRLVRFLRTATADIVLNGRTEVDQEGVAMHTVNVWDSLYAEKYDGQTVRLSTLEPFVYGIWVVTYRTALLQEHPFTLPEKQLYTDRMFITYPIPWIRTVAFQNFDVYCYRTGHEGQSVSTENRIRHAREAISGFETLLDYYEQLGGMPRSNREFLDLRVSRYYNNVLQTILMLPASMKAMRQIRDLDRRVRDVSGRLYRVCGENNRMLRNFRKFTYGLYWIRKMKKVKNWA